MLQRPCRVRCPPSRWRRASREGGDVLLTLEAMKMETAIHAAQDCTIGEIAVKPGAQVDAKDLLIVLA